MRVSIEEQAGELMTIPLSLLVPSARNVRKQGGTNIDELAALIKAQGLMQNLIVIEHERSGGKRSGKYEVVAGSRRLRALQRLQKQGAIAKDEEILCKVTTRDQALMASVAENSGREAMHPADEFEAFRQMIEAGHSIDAVADRFGVPLITVRRRLKLANVAPKLVEAYRRDEASLEQLMALAVTDDQEAQERVWNDAPAWQRTPHSLRRALTAQEIDLRNPVARFVTIEAYEQAGGTVRRDLFAEDDAGAIVDAELLRRLATARLEEAAAQLKTEGWAWVDVQLETDYQVLSNFGRLPMVHRAPTEKESAAIERLRVQISKTEAALNKIEDAEKYDEDKANAFEGKLESLSTELLAVNESLRDWPPDGKQIAGVLVRVGQGGTLQVHRGLIRAEDRKQAASRLRSMDGNQRAEKTAQRVHSEPLMRKLTAHRTIALQAVLAKRTHIALASLAHCLVERLVLNEIGVDSALEIRVGGCWPRLSGVAEGIESTDAWQQLHAEREQWRARLSGQQVDLLQTLIALPEEQLLKLLALCAALTVNAVTEREGEHSADALVAAAGVDMADWWTPTAASYFNQVSRARVLEAVTEAVSAEAARNLLKLKKAELVAKAEALMVGRRWLPSTLRAVSAADTDASIAESTIAGDAEADLEEVTA